MTEQRCGLRGLPVAWLFGMEATALGLFALRTVSPAQSPDVLMALIVAGHALCGFGALELAQRSTGRVRRGLRVAAAGWWLAVALEVLARVLPAIHLMLLRDGWGGVAVSTASWFATVVLPMIGLAIASWHHRPGLAVALVAVVAVCAPPPVAVRVMGGLYPWAAEAYGRAGGMLVLVRFAISVALASMVPAGVELVEPERAARELRRAARALQLRAAVAIVAFAAVPLTSNDPDEIVFLSATDVVVVTGFAIGSAVFGWFGAALIRAATSGVAELGRSRLAVAGGLALGCSYLMLGDIATKIAGYDRQGLHAVFSNELLRWAPASSLALVAAVASMALVASAVAGLAARRGQAVLRRAAISKGVLTVILMMGAASTHPLGLVGGPLCTLAALLMMASLGRAAAVELDQLPRVPPARVVAAS